MSTIETDELKPWWIKLKEALEQKNEDNYCKVDATDLEFSIEDYQRIHQQLQSLHTSLVVLVAVAFPGWIIIRAMFNF